MIVIILIVLTVLLILFFVGFIEDDWSCAILLSIVGAFIALILGGLCCVITSEFYPLSASDKIDIVEDNQIELVALEDNQSIYGSAFLFSAYIKDELTYNYIYEDPQYGMTTGSVKAEDCFIRYIDENKQPYIQIWHTQPKNKIIDWLFVPEVTYYTIYLPQGSVIENQYNIDLK